MFFLLGVAVAMVSFHRSRNSNEYKGCVQVTYKGRILRRPVYKSLVEEGA